MEHLEKNSEYGTVSDGHLSSEQSELQTQA